MYCLKDLINILVEKNPTYKKNRVLFIIKEYIIVVTQELLKGNKVEFPSEFGTVEVIKRNMKPKYLKWMIDNKIEIIDYFYHTKVEFVVKSLRDFDMKIYAAKPISMKVKYFVKNKLKVYRYVNQ